MQGFAPWPSIELCGLGYMVKKKNKLHWEPNALFRGGPNYQLNACVGDNGGSTDFYDHGKGFFQAAQGNVNLVKYDGGTIDLLIYPICFTFRHGIELYLKALNLALVEYLNKDIRTNPIHGMEKIWSSIKNDMINLDDIIIDKTEIGIISDIISDFDKIDYNGQVFRYPLTNDGDKHLNGLTLINIEVLSEGMVIFEELVSNWIFRLRDINENRDG